MAEQSLIAKFFDESFAELESLSPVTIEGRGRRLGVPVPSVKYVGEQLPFPPGEHIRRVGPNLFRWASGRLAPRFPEPGGTVFCQSWADVEWATTHTLRLMERLPSAGLEDGVLEAELDNGSKAVLESGHTGCGHMSPEGITNTADVDMPGLPQFARWLLTREPPYRSDYDMDMKITRGTSHGWPSYVSGGDPGTNVDLAAHFWLAGMLAEEQGDLSRFAERYAREVQPHPIPISAVMFSRAGPSKKAAQHYKPHADGIFFESESVGYFCRERQVFAVPTFLNLYLRPAATRVKYWLRSDPSFKHGTGAETARKIRELSHLTFVSEDINGYDRSVTRKMQSSLLRHVYAHILTPEEQVAYDQLQELPILAPPLKRGEQGFLYARSGMTASGSIFTSNDGSILNAASIGYSVAKALDIPLDEVWNLKGSRWDMLVLTDDCVVGFDKWDATIERKYLAARKETGLSTSTFRGVVFLMTCVDTRTYEVTGVLTRALSKTFFRERPSRSLLVDLLGLYYRWDRSTGHPLFEVTWQEAIAAHPEARALGLVTFDRLARIVEHPSFVAQVLKDAQQTAVAKALRDLLTGIGHGDLEDGFGIVPGSLALWGGFAADAMVDMRTGISGAIASEALKGVYRAGRHLWPEYFRMRASGLNVSVIARKMGLPLNPGLVV
jgi:hypothetical protein